jgi:hypothetical protein
MNKVVSISQLIGSVSSYKGFLVNAHHIKKRRIGGRLCYARKDLTDTLQTCFKVFGFFYVLFSGSNLSAYERQS